MDATNITLASLPRLYEGRNSLIYLQGNSGFGKPVVIKTLKPDRVTPREIERLTNEYELTKDLAGSGVRSAYDSVLIGGRPALVLEYIEGETLREALVEKQGTLEEILAVAISVAAGLHTIHGRKITHGNISGTNILINRRLQAATIIDFASALKGTWKIDRRTDLEVLERLLPYISPEQTGQINRPVDTRADLYSFGIVLYEVLAGRLPFETTAPLELIHLHIAKNPAPVRDLNPKIPPAISDIVMRLIAKNPEERYQSAHGVKTDLENCLQQLQSRGRIEMFALAGEDFSGILSIPQKVYGRERELGILTEAVEAVSRGAAQVLLVAGNAGAGKTMLVNEIRKPVTDLGGFFIFGTHDVYQRNAPYFALIQAFSEMADLLLMKSTEQLARWKTKILQAIDGNGTLLNEVIPHLEFIIGPQPPVSELGLAEAQIRFHHVFQKFIRVFGENQHPLILFLDNLQWADTASLNLLEFLLGGVENPYVLFIGTYRNDEVGPSHPLSAMLEALKRLKTAVREISLENFTPAILNILISDALKTKTAEAQSLSDLVYKKTGGNALFAVQFLQSLPEEGLLIFDYNVKRWVWEIAHIRNRAITVNVISLLTRKIVRLPQSTQELLSLAACMGNRFTLKDLAAVAEQSPAVVFETLRKAIEEGLLLASADSYLASKSEIERSKDPNWKLEFPHDRVRQAAYSLIPRKRQKTVHLKIGRLLLRNSRDIETEENIFGITDHFNEGFQYLTDEREKLRLVELNWVTGRRAVRETAHKAAIWYFSMGIGMLPADRWERHARMTLDLYSEAMKAEYLNANFERAELLANEILQHAQIRSTRIRILEFKVLLHAAQNRNEEAIQDGLEALHALGVYLPAKPGAIKAHAEKLVRELSETVGRIEDLIHLKTLCDENQLSVLRILMNLVTPAYYANSELLKMLIVEMVLKSIRQGNSPIAAFAYGWYAVLLCGAGGDIERGYRYGRLSIEVQKIFKAADLEVKTKYLFNVFVRHWNEHAQATLRPLRKISQSGLETGELEYTYYGAIHYCSYLFCTGGPLEYVRQRQEEYLEALNRYRLEYHEQFAKIWGQTVLNFLGRSKDPCRLSGELLHETALLPIWIEKGNRELVFCTYCCRTMLQYWFGCYEAAVESAHLAEPYEPSVEGYIYLAEFYFYQGLALLAVYPEADAERKKDCLNRVTVIQKRMQEWARHAPMNFQHKYDLIEAERARALGEMYPAARLYGNALGGARENGYIQIEALTHEREAELYLALGREDFAGFCIRKAVAGYRMWGAVRKADALEERYGYLLMSEKTPSLDTAAIIKASHMLSREIRLEQLLDKMMRIVIENAGAERGVLIENKSGRLVIQAQGEIGREQIETMQEVPVEKNAALPVTIINYVARTHTSVVLNDASHDSTYAADKYITEHRIKSLLCLPIVHQGKLSGLLYLENNLATNVFTPDRLELLKTISSQAAISMENAGLYANLERSIRELKLAKEQREALIRQLEDKNAELERFTYTVSHDLKSPLITIKGFLGLAQGDAAKGDAVQMKSDMERIANAADKMSMLLDELLEFSRIGRIVNPAQRVSLAELAREAVELTLGQIQNRGVQVEIASDLPVASVDRSRFLQVLENLIDNAVKFMGDQPEPKVRIGVRYSGDEAVCCVSDNGMGIDLRYRDKIFGLFEKLDPKSQGTGVGLAIVKRVIEIHGGRIWIESEGVGKGATVCFTVPSDTAASSQA